MKTRTKAPPSASPTPPPAASTRVDAVTPTQYEAARAAWLEAGSYEAVARAAGISKERARRLVDSGVPGTNLPALRHVARTIAERTSRELAKRESRAAEEEAAAMAATLEARAAAAQRAAEDQRRILGDAAESRAEEVRLVRANRRSAIVLAEANARLLRAGLALATSIEEDAASGKLRALSPRERAGLLRTIAGVVHRAAQASQTAVQMERLLMGEPTAILGHAAAGPSAQDMTPAEAEQWLRLATRAFERRASRATLIDSAPDPDASTRVDASEADELAGVAS